MRLVEARTSEEPLECKVRLVDWKEGEGLYALTTATGSLMSGSITAGLMMSRVKPETGAHPPSSTKSGESGEARLTVF